MKRCALVLGLLIAAVLISQSISVEATTGPDRSKIKEDPVGVVPNSFGDLVNVTTGNSTQLFLTFKDSDGDLRIIRFTSGGQLPNSCMLIKRGY